MSACPWARPARFHAVWPWRSRTRVRASGIARRGLGRQVDGRAVAPQPLEGVELPLLLVLHVHDDLAVVEQHPATLAVALATDRLGARIAQLVLDLVHERADLAVVGRGGDQEGVRDGELVTDVEGDDLLGLFVRRRERGD